MTTKLQIILTKANKQKKTQKKPQKIKKKMKKSQQV